MDVLRAHKTLGTIFLVLLITGVWLTYAIFTQRFTDFREVTLETSKIGLQLPERADVKIRGMIVGEVRGIDTTGDGAELTLGLFADKMGDIPADVTGSIIPKTLFGQKEVDLVPPEGSSAEPIQEGAVIERTVVATEVEQVLSDLQPLLTAVQPGDLNMTLNALMTALEGRGDRLGDNLERLDAYLGKLNPELPALMEDLRLTAEVSDVYADVVPQIGDILRNTVTTMTTLEGREARLQALLGDVSQLSDVTGRFLTDNEDNLIRVGQLGAESLETFARYSPEYPCLLGGLVNAGVDQGEAFRDFTLHINLELLENQPRAYDENDAPRVGEDRGPNCIELPNPPYTQDNRFDDIPNFDDGVDRPTGKGTTRVAPGAAIDGTADRTAGGTAPERSAGPVAPRYTSDGSGYVGGPEEADFLRGFLAPAMGTTVDDVPDLGVLLLAPMARGGEVELR